MADPARNDLSQQTSSASAASFRPHYLAVLKVFFINALTREMSFRSNFFITLITRLCWFGAQLMLFNVIYQRVTEINDWNRYEYFGFMATGMLINALVEAVFMPNCANFSEMIRSGNLDFVLLKPADTQFLVSFEKMDLSMFNQVLFAVSLLVYAIVMKGTIPPITAIVWYLILLASAVAFFYSLMLALASTSIWFGRNQSLLDFWFYVTVFARYPGSIYSGSPVGEIVRVIFSYVLPILLVVTVPARVIMSMVLEPSFLSLATVAAAIGSLIVSRLIFQYSLSNYRSASS